jgi:tetratricopeptide (TPR) repeat protein
LGRKDELAAIDALFCGNQRTLLLAGMGGIGKSSLCAVWYKDYAQKNDQILNIGWIDCKNGVAAGLAESGLYQKFGLQTEVKRLCDYLNQMPHTLLVLDDIRDENEDAFLLLKQTNLHLVATSRQTLHHFKAVQVGFLSIEACKDLFLQHFQTPDTHSVSELVRLAGRHTLTLELIAKTIENSDKTAKEMLNVLQDHGLDLSKLADIETVDYQKDGEAYNQRLTEALTTLFDVAQLPEDERELLYLFGHFNSQPFTRKFVKQMLDLDNLEGINNLIKKGWVSKASKSHVQFYALHPVISDVAKNSFESISNKLSEEKVVQLFENTLLLLSDEVFDEAHPGDFHCLSLLLSFLAHLNSHTVQYAGVIARIAYWLVYTANYAAALPLYERTLSISEKVLGPEHPKVVDTLNNLALLYQSLGNNTEALPLYERALSISEKVLGPEHPSVAAILNNLAGFYQSMANYTKALSLYERTLSIGKKVLGPEHPDVATTLNNLAGLYQLMGNYTEALPLYERALSIREKVLGPEHPFVATTLNNLAGLYQSMGNYTEALPLCERALSTSEKVFGPEHPDVANTLNNLAGLYQSLGNYTKALPLYERALSIREKVFGPEHPDVATTLNNLAVLYNLMGNYTEALPLYERVLSIREKVLGPEHPYVGTTLANLALLYQSMGNYTEALPLYERDLAISEKVLGPEHPSVASTLNGLAGLYQSLGNSTEALPLYERALSISEKVFGPEHPDVANTLNNLAGLYQSLGNSTEALPLYERALSISEKVFGPEHPSVANTLNNLAGLYQSMGNYKKALPLYERALSIREKVFGPEHPYNKTVTENMQYCMNKMKGE